MTVKRHLLSAYTLLISIVHIPHISSYFDFNDTSLSSLVPSLSLHQHHVIYIYELYINDKYTYITYLWHKYYQHRAFHETWDTSSQPENEIRINLEHEYCDTNSLIYYFSDSTEKVGLKLLSVFVWNCKFCIVCEKLGESGVVTWKNPFLFFTIFKYHN